jgi:hypothetical protein
MKIENVFAHKISEAYRPLAEEIMTFYRRTWKEYLEEDMPDYEYVELTNGYIQYRLPHIAWKMNWSSSMWWPVDLLTSKDWKGDILKMVDDIRTERIIARLEE